VRGVSPFQGVPERLENMARIANQAAVRLGLDITLAPRDFVNDDSYVGERYGIPTPDGIAALKLVATQEGILLDPVYTSKAMAKLIADIGAAQVDRRTPILFMHTGGAPALFGYSRELLAEA